MKKITHLLIAFIFIFSSSAITNAQYGYIKLSNGVTVAVKTEINPSPKQNSLGNIYSSNSGNVIHRILTDRKNKIYFGYDLTFVKEEETGKFRVSIKPLSKTPDEIMKNSRMTMSRATRATRGTGSNSGGVSVGRSGTGETSASNQSNYTDYTETSLPNYPEDFVLADGDTVRLDILENPQTSTKITDVIRITSKSEGFTMITSDDKPIKDFSIDDVIFRLERPRIYINEKEYKTNATIAGNVSWIYIRGKGRFIFSIKPITGYDFQKIGAVKNNQVTFEHNGESYKFICKSPVVGHGGNWNLWVMHDPSYRPNYDVSEEDPFTFGAAGSIRNVFNMK
jgi:hypothetical protein